MDLTTAVIGSLLNRLANLLRDDMRRSVNRRQVIFLSMKLESHRAFLLRLAEAPPDMVDEQVRLWAHKVKEVCYNMEDRLDTLLLDVPRRPEPIGSEFKHFIFMINMEMHMAHRRSIRAMKARGGDFAAAIEDMINQLKEVDEQRRRCKLDEILVKKNQVAAASVDPRLPALYRNERELVGIDEARGKLVEMLAQGDDGNPQALKIVSIHGMGGVGKTTLAKAVYNMLQAEFDCSAFVSVSWNPDMTKVLRDIILELDDAEDYARLVTMDDYWLIDKILEFLKNKRFLIVIDDIWTTRVWETIRLALVDSHRGSRVIITSRNYGVAAEGGRAIYRLKPLSYDNSEELLYKRIFGGQGNYPNNSQLDEVCDKILKKCSGLPLAIITAASVLASKPSEDWSEVYGCIAALSHGSNRYMDNMRMVLSYSYYNLPVYLRACTLHLSMFPENCWIEKDLLIWQWIAEGYVVDREHGTSLFEIGEAYLNELVNSSMIEIAEGHAGGCRVHPIVFSLIRSISREEYFSTVLDDDEHHGTSAGSSNNTIVRRIAVHRRRNVEHHHIDSNNMMTMGKVRSFSGSLCFVDSTMPQLSSFQVLRVLALEYCPGLRSTQLRQIGNLVHLRYLGLVGAGELDELPEETVGGLRYLQTLDLRETRISTLPRSISMLQHLMCLCAGSVQTVPEGMVRSLISLEDLRIHCVSGRVVSAKMAAELGRLERLRVLEIGFADTIQRHEVLEKVLLKSLRKLHKIQHLQVYCKAYSRAVMWGKEKEEGGWDPPRCIRRLVVGGAVFSKLPRWIHPGRLPQLSHLHLILDVVEDRHVKTLGCLPELRSLVLLTDRKEEFVVGADHGAFTQLKVFASNVPVKFETRLGQPPMPNLEQVEFRVSGPASVEAASSWFSSLANVPSLANVTVVVLQDRCTSTSEVDKAAETLRHEAGIHANRRLKIQVTRKYETDNDEVPFYHQFRFRNPHFEDLQLEMEKIMMSNRQEAGSQVVPHRDSDEITIARLQETPSQ